MFLPTDWVMDRTEAAEILRAIDKEERCPTACPEYALYASCVIADCVENQVDAWSRGGPIYYRD